MTRNGPAATPVLATARQSTNLRSQIALVFGVLMVALGLLLSTVMGEMLKQRIQKDAGASLHIVARNASKLLASGLQERALEVSVLAAAQPLWAQGLDAPQVLQAMQRSPAMQPRNTLPVDARTTPSRPACWTQQDGRPCAHTRN